MNRSADHPIDRYSSSISVTLVLAWLAGCITLLYQITLVRIGMAQFGAESETLAAIVCMSLIGLAAGAYFSGRLANQMLRPMKHLAKFMFGGAILQLAFWGMGNWIVEFISSTDLPDALQKLTFATLTALPTNMMLGTTLPLLTAVTGTSQQSRAFAAIYAAETFGAAFGGLFAAFFLIPRFGLSSTALLTVAVTILAAVLSLVPGQRGKQSHEVAAPPSINRNPRASFQRNALLVAVMLAGVSSMGSEIVWQRFFVLLFGSDTQSFSVVAATYLIGVSLGASLSNRLLNWISDRIAAYSVVIAWTSATCVLSTLALIHLALAPHPLFHGFDWINHSPVLYRITIAFVVLVVPTILIGMGLPLAVAFESENARDTPTAIGQIYTAALLGNVGGLLATGFFISAGNGLRTTVLLLSLIAMLAAGMLLLVYTIKVRFNWRYLFVIVVPLLLWIPSSLHLQESKLPLGISLDQWNLDYYSEGKSNIVAVASSKANPQNRRMIIDGVTIGESLGGVDEKQQMLAHLPFLIDPSRRDLDGVTIGLGTGILAGVLADNERLTQLTCVELSADVIAASDKFSDINGKLKDREHVDIVNADGIQYLRRLTAPVDLIVSDAKSRPGHSGNVAFFSRDYYQLCQRKLDSNGTFVQWISLETAKPAVRTILASFRGTFEFGYVAIAPSDSIYLVGSRSPVTFSSASIEQYLQDNLLRRYNWSAADDIASLGWLEQSELSDLPQTINSFDRPLLELYSLDSSGKSPAAHKLENLKWLRSVLDSSQEADRATLEGAAVEPFVARGRAACLDLIEAAILTVERPDNWLDRAGTYAKSAHRVLPDLNRHQVFADLYRQLAEQAKIKVDESTRFSALLNISEMGLASAAEEFELGEILKRNNQTSQSLNHFFKAANRQPQNQKYQIEFGYSLLESGKPAQALRVFQKLIKKDPQQAGIRLAMGICQLTLGRNDDGWQNVRRAIRQQPELQETFQKYQSTIQGSH